MKKIDIHPNTFKAILNYATSKDYKIMIDGKEYVWDRWYDGWKLESGILILKNAPNDVSQYIHLEAISDIEKGEDMRSISFKEGNISHILILVEHIHLTPLLNHVLSCF